MPWGFTCTIRVRSMRTFYDPGADGCAGRTCSGRRGCGFWTTGSAWRAVSSSPHLLTISPCTAGCSPASYHWGGGSRSDSLSSWVKNWQSCYPRPQNSSTSWWPWRPGTDWTHSQRCPWYTVQSGRIAEYWWLSTTCLSWSVPQSSGATSQSGRNCSWISPWSSMISFQELKNLEWIFEGSNIGRVIVLSKVLFLSPITAYYCLLMPIVIGWFVLPIVSYVLNLVIYWIQKE